VVRQPARVGARRAQPAEVDDPADARGAAGVGEGGGGLPVDGGEVTAAVDRVDEVVGHLDVRQRLGQGSRVTRVGLDDPGARRPPDVAQTGRVAGHRPHVVPTVDQAGDQPTADVAGCPRHEYAHTGYLPRSQCARTT